MITGPTRIDPLEQTAQHPRRTQLPLPHPRPPTRAITPSVTTYRSFQIKGDTQTNEHAHGPLAALTRSGYKTGTVHVTHAARLRPPSRRAVSDAAVRDAPAPAIATATWFNWHQPHSTPPNQWRHPPTAAKHRYNHNHITTAQQNPRLSNYLTPQESFTQLIATTP